MSIKAILTHEYINILTGKRKGSYLTKKKFYITIKSITAELIQLKCAPKHWHALYDEQIIKLVKFWQNKGIKGSTMATRLSVLRSFLALANIKINFPSNAALGVKITKKRYCKNSDNFSLSKIYHPITKTIIDFEMQFGLNKFESIKTVVNTVTANDNLTIYRDASHNHQDRIIPILTKEQQEAITARLNILQGKDSLTQIAPCATILKLYSGELGLLNITDDSYFRTIYAKRRFAILIKDNPENKALNILQTELGLYSQRVLKRYLK